MRRSIFIATILAGCAAEGVTPTGSLSGAPAQITPHLLLNTAKEESTVTFLQGTTVCVARFTAPYGEPQRPVIATCNDGRAGSGGFVHSRPFGTFEVQFALNDGTLGYAKF